MLTACSEQIEYDTRLWHKPPVRSSHGRVSQGLKLVSVQKGDTVFAISRRYNVEVKTIIEVNGLEAPYILKPGDRLKLTYPTIHVVKRGETSYAISRRYGVDLTSLMRVNHIEPPYRVFVGQQLEVPDVAIAKKAPLSPPPTRSGKDFMWPVRGTVISNYGPKTGGLHNDGVNIKTAIGTPVRAAENGVVAYAGNGLKGYGNLLLLRHDGGWVTAYAHNDRLLVTRGQQVSRGQQIALAGMSGNVDTAQLHFEVRKGTAAVNPLLYLQ